MDHTVPDFSILALAASRAEAVSQEDLGMLTLFRDRSAQDPTSSPPADAVGGGADLDDLSSLSDFEWAPSSDVATYRRDQYCPFIILAELALLIEFVDPKGTLPTGANASSSPSTPRPPLTLP